jgi:hypothetical protein
VVAGAACGLVLGAALLAFAIVHAATGAPGPCPHGFVPTEAPVIPGARALGACVEHVADASATPMVLAVYRAERGSAASAADEAMVAFGRSRHVFNGAPPAPDADASDRASTPVLHIASRTSTREVPLLAEVYLLAAGHRFGLLSVVHAPGASFARPRDTAAWMDTITGTSPWGTENAGPITAHCPDGFTTRPVQGPSAVAECVFGADTGQFTALSLSVNDGGFANDDERHRVAATIATRAAQSHENAGRVLEGPVPFTLARNVDALHVSVESGEHAQVQSAVTAAFVEGDAQDEVALAAAEGDADVVAPLRVLAGADGLAHRRGPIGIPHGVVATMLLGFLGAAVGVLLSRRAR